MSTELPTKVGPYYWRETDGDKWELWHVLDNGSELTAHRGFNVAFLPDLGGQWLPIPTAEELVELLRLVDEVTGWENDLIDTNEFSEDGEAMINDIDNLREYAQKLKKGDD